MGRLCGVVLAFAGASSGEEALDGAFEAGQALGQRLDIVAKSSHVATNFRAEVLHVGAHLGSERRQVAADFQPQRLCIGARIAPKRPQQPNHRGTNANQGGAYGEDSD